MTTQVTLLGAERVGGEQRDQGGVDAAREGDADVAEAVLADVVAQAERRAPRRPRRGRRAARRAAGRRGRGPRRPAAPPRTGRRGRSTSPSGSTTRLWPSKTSSSWPPTRLQKAKCGAVGARPLGEHRFALAALAAVVGRARRVGDQLGARRRLARGGRARRPSSPRRSSARPGARRPRPSPARRRGRSSAARRRPRSWAAGSCGRRRAPRRRRGRRASCGRGGSRRRRRPARRSRPGRSMPSTPRASSSTARRLASTKCRFR